MMPQDFSQVKDETNVFARERNSSDSTTDGEFLASTPSIESPSINGRKRPSYSFDSSGSVSSETVDESISEPVEKKRRKSGSGPSSKYRGVCRNRRKWQAVIWVHGKRKYLGTFKDEESAARAYDVAALHLEDRKRVVFPSSSPHSHVFEHPEFECAPEHITRISFTHHTDGLEQPTTIEHPSNNTRTPNTGTIETARAANKRRRRKPKKEKEGGRRKKHRRTSVATTMMA